MGFIIILVAILQIVLQHLNLSKIIHKLLFGELDLSLDSSPEFPRLMGDRKRCFSINPEISGPHNLNHEIVQKRDWIPRKTTPSSDGLPVKNGASSFCAKILLRFVFWVKVVCSEKRILQNSKNSLSRKNVVMNWANKVTDLLIFWTHVLCKYILLYSLITSILL